MNDMRSRMQPFSKSGNAAGAATVFAFLTSKPVVTFAGSFVI